ncbi:DUF445 family protein [Bacillus carboniphilus]|uniref:DUF445 family protein n=1 Tax=Bacillus carboniphilus TaxID=86663 RepID=A0ABN0W836_9BACI
MNIWVMILFLGSIGAVIGGITNFLAIKMLFRPYNPIYIGKFKLPFTPGLIPKRRDELAQQLGKLVVEHLITKERLENRLLTGSFKEEMTELVQQEAKKLLVSEKSIQHVLEGLGIHDMEERADHFINEKVEAAYLKIMEKYGESTIGQTLPEELKGDIRNKIHVITSYILEKGEAYFSSAEGKWRIQKMADDFMQNRGMLGNMLQMFLGNVNLVDKIQPEIIKFIRNEGTHDLLYSLFCNEWDKLQEQKLEEIEGKFDREQIVTLFQNVVRNAVPVHSLLQKSVKETIDPFSNSIIHTFIPKLVDIGGKGIVTNLDQLLAKLQIDQLVQEQVKSFSLERVEEMVLSITRSELKMITYLGALLGGVIGVIQSVILQVIA